MENFLKKKITLTASMANITGGAAVTTISVFLILYAIPYQITEGYGKAAYGVTSKTFPYMISIVSLILGLALILSGLKAHQANRGKEEPVISFYMISLVVVALIAVFTIFFRTLGYPIVNIILVVGMYFLSGGKKLWKGLVLAVVCTIAFVLFFKVYLRLSIPMGLFSFLM